jgi:DNA-binding MarR family transcriptional regulator
MGLVEDLSAAFVAFTIEVDDAAEGRIAHRTTRGGDGREGGKGTWLVSLAMYRNCMQWLPATGLSTAELVATARTSTNFAGMKRWGYIEIDGDTVRPTRRGARAREVWDGVPDEIEARWTERFGTALRPALVPLVEQLDPGLPDTMPIIHQGWHTRREEEPERLRGPVAVVDLGLDSLLARPLSTFALESEASGKLSLALHANLLAVLDENPTPLRDLADATGIHRAQIDNAVGYLERARLADVIPPPGAKRGRSVALTPRGTNAKARGAAKLAKLEAAWDERHGARLARVREALASIAPTDPEHPPGTWRAESKPLARLPRFPLVTHRGGFPDGA